MSEEKKKFSKEAGLLYAKINHIPIPEGGKKKDIIAAISKVVGEQTYTCNDCDKYIRDSDIFCWFCGEDVSEDGTGGYKNALKQYDEEPSIEFQDQGEIDKVKEEEVDDEVDEEVEEEVEEEVDSVVSEEIKQKIIQIKSLDQRSGQNAWLIGKSLYEISGGREYRNLGYSKFDDFCQKELGYTRITAHNFIKIAKVFSEEQAGQLGVFKLMQLSRVQLTDEKRAELFQAALPISDGGLGLDRKDLTEKVKEAIREIRQQSGKDPEVKGRKPSSPFKRFIDTMSKASFDREKTDTVIVPLDDDVGIEIKLLKKQIKVQFVELEQ